MKKILVALTVILMMFPAGAFAAGLCCQLSSGVQESLLGVASPESKRLSVQLSYSLSVMDRFKEGSSSKSLDDLQMDGRYSLLPTKMNMTKYTMTVGYGFSPRLSAFVSIPYIRNTMDMAMQMGMMWKISKMDSIQELGDVTLMGLYRIYTDFDVAPNNALTVGLGVKTPTGSSTVKGSSGKFIHAHMQPGTGSWDPLIAIVYARMMNPFLLQADATYQLATRNSDGYRFGDSFTANLVGKYAVSRIFNITGGLTFLHVNGSSDRDGKYTNLNSLMDDPANTGGNSLWLSPGLQLLPSKGSLIDVKVQVPVWEHVKGVQLVSRYRILLGVSYSF